mgnify:FL=1
MINQIEEKFGVYTYYDVLSLPFDRNINYPNEIQSKVDFLELKPKTQKAILQLPIVQFTGDFKAGGLNKKQRLYLMSKMDDVYFIDTRFTNYANCVTQLLNIPDLSNKALVTRTDEHRKIKRIGKTERYSVIYKDVNYIIEITDETDGTFTSIEYDNKLVMDYMLEKDILEFFNNNK